MLFLVIRCICLIHFLFSFYLSISLTFNGFARPFVQLNFYSVILLCWDLNHETQSSLKLLSLLLLLLSLFFRFVIVLGETFVIIIFAVVIFRSCEIKKKKKTLLAFSCIYVLMIRSTQRMQTTTVITFPNLNYQCSNNYIRQIAPSFVIFIKYKVKRAGFDWKHQNVPKTIVDEKKTNKSKSFCFIYTLTMLQSIFFF